MRLDHKFWEFAEKQDDYRGAFRTWIDYWEGCCLCACDHGCNQFLQENAAKAAALLSAASTTDTTMTTLDAMARKDEKEFLVELWKRNRLCD